MNKTINAALGGRKFTIDEDAYSKLDKYLKNFRKKANLGMDTKEMMEDIEARIADLFEAEIRSSNQVVDNALVTKVISQLGMPDGSPGDENAGTSSSYQAAEVDRSARKFFRDKEQNILGGVCAGASHYFNIDVVLVRILFVLLFLCGFSGFFIYLILWIVCPRAVTAADKCQMHGLPVTAENMKQFQK